jgi:hypothetical protein
VTAVVAGFMGQQASSVGKMARRAGVDVIPVDIGINKKDSGDDFSSLLYDEAAARPT